MTPSQAEQRHAEGKTRYREQGCEIEPVKWKAIGACRGRDEPMDVDVMRSENPRRDCRQGAPVSLEAVIQKQAKGHEELCRYQEHRHHAPRAVHAQEVEA